MRGIAFACGVISAGVLARRSSLVPIDGYNRAITELEEGLYSKSLFSITNSKKQRSSVHFGVTNATQFFFFPQISRSVWPAAIFVFFFSHHVLQVTRTRQ
jgi:hypothetical protein